MQERYLDFWGPKPPGSLLAIPTDGFIKHNECAVMGRGVLAQAKHRFKGIDIGTGNHVTMLWKEPWIASFPIKWVFWERSDLWLIERSCLELAELADKTRLRGVYLPPIGDGHPYSEVFALMDKYMDERFVICMER